MKIPPQPSNREVLAGLLVRVTYQNAENGFCVIRVKARGHRDLVTVVGPAAVISAGEWITASGDWTNDHTHGQQFKARFLKTSAPTSVESIEKYLASGMIRGIGPVYAKKLLRAFGERVFSTSSRRSPTACGRWMASDRCAQLASQPLGPSRKSSAKSWCFCTAMGSDLQDLRCRRRAGHVGEPVPPGPRHPRHWFQDG
jgi:ATP-dependent exoDNAse (exonuclease V) alpha subunit